MAAKTSDNNEVIADINIVPLVDIILVVLIIFMVTAQTVVHPSLDINLPEASHSEPNENISLEVSITSDGRTLVNNVEVDASELKQLASDEFAKNKDIQTIISADQGTNYGLVISVLDSIKGVGIQNFAVTTQGEEQ